MTVLSHVSPMACQGRKKSRKGLSMILKSDKTISNFRNCLTKHGKNQAKQFRNGIYYTEMKQ